MHPDFTITTLTMNVYTSGNYDIFPESGVTITSPSSTASITFPSFINGTFAYQQSSADSLNVQIITSSQSYLSLLENSYIEIMPSLTCSSLSSTTISYSISNYNGVTAPKWVDIDSTSGLLKIKTPNVTNSLSASFYVNSQISGFINTYQKVINLKVSGCAIKNCVKCSAKDTTICDECIPNYTFSNGACILINSVETLNIVSNSVIGGVCKS